MLSVVIYVGPVNLVVVTGLVILVHAFLFIVVDAVPFVFTLFLTCFFFYCPCLC